MDVMDAVTLDDCNDIVFALVGNHEETALKWWFGYNHAFGKSPMQMIADGRLEEVYSYLHLNYYGPY